LLGFRGSVFGLSPLSINTIAAIAVAAIKIAAIHLFLFCGFMVWLFFSKEVNYLKEH
jgi:hypothetical protein